MKRDNERIIQVIDSFNSSIGKIITFNLPLDSFPSTGMLLENSSGDRWKITGVSCAKKSEMLWSCRIELVKGNGMVRKSDVLNIIGKS